MENLHFTADLVHKQRLQELQEEAKVERFLQEKKGRDEQDWLQRRIRRLRKNR